MNERTFIYKSIIITEIENFNRLRRRWLLVANIYEKYARSAHVILGSDTKKES